MDLTFDADAIALRAEADALVDAIDGARMLTLRAETEAADVERHAPSMYAELCRRGWVGLGWPAPHGRGATHAQRFALHEALDGGGVGLYGVEISESIGWMLVRHGPTALAERHLAKIVDGTWTYAAGYSEPDAGSDLLALRTRAVRDGEAYRVTGSKLWTSAAHVADWIFAVVRTDAEGRRHEGLSILLIDTKSPGVEIRPVRVLGGWRVNACFFDDVVVPVEQRVGAEHDGWAILSEALNVERSMSFGGRESRLLLARLLHRLGAAGQPALDAARLEKLGWLVTELEVERLLHLRVTAMADRDTIAPSEASMLKVQGSELAQEVTAFVAGVLGPEAQYDAADQTDVLAADAEAAVRVSTVLTVIGGTSEVQRNTVARGLGFAKAT